MNRIYNKIIHFKIIHRNKLDFKNQIDQKYFKNKLVIYRRFLEKLTIFRTPGIITTYNYNKAFHCVDRVWNNHCQLYNS